MKCCANCRHWEYFTVTHSDGSVDKYWGICRMDAIKTESGNGGDALAMLAPNAVCKDAHQFHKKEGKMLSKEEVWKMCEE